MNDARGSGSTNSVQSFLVSKATDSHSSAPHVLNDLEQMMRCQPSESKPEGPADPLVFFAAFWIASISMFSNIITTNETDFFAQRVLRYWNSLPPLVKVSESVTGFKRGLDAFRLHGYQANKLGHYWELSYDIFDRIDESVSNRNSYVSYMKENPLVAKRKKVNIKGI